MSDEQGLSPEELDAEQATALPDKEVVSILDLNADINLAVDAAAPIDLAAAANANIAAPIEAAASGNILSVGSGAEAVSDQTGAIHQGINADATANAVQQSGIDQGGTDTGATDPGATDPGATDAGGTDTSTAGAGTADPGTADTSTTTNLGAGATQGPLLNVDVNVDGDVGVAAPVDGAVAANANAAAPIDASVAANVGSVGSDAISASHQDVTIDQNIDGSATASTDQSSDIQQ
jgi:hypothetical protein